MSASDKNELITTQIEKELTALVFQGYSIFKKFLKARKESLEVCSKCGSADIFTVYCDKNHFEDPRFPLHLQHGTSETLHLTCENCQYSYLKPVLKSGKP
jgi:predicted nucleic-acid-binding Zn-ribbon protein